MLMETILQTTCFKYVDDEVFAQMSVQQQHWVILSMLEVNLENSDAIKALKIWQVAKPIVLISAPSANQISSYAEKLINAFQLHHNETLIEQEINNLPACLDTDYMIDYKLFFYAQHSADKFHTLVKTLHSPLRRSSLTSLLKALFNFEMNQMLKRLWRQFLPILLLTVKNCKRLSKSYSKKVKYPKHCQWFNE